jgi:hypothetical protein
MAPQASKTIEYWTHRRRDALRLALIAAFAAAPCVSAPTAPSPFEEFLPQFVEGTQRFLSGDASLWKQHASRSGDVTIMGAWGAYERTWSRVGPRYDWAAARFQRYPATLEVEYLARVVSGDAAYTVAIERSRTLIVGRTVAAPMVLRVTHIFRREREGWKLVHRHADPLVEKTAPDAVLQR